jgi:DNA (cytosine-5)-methyltransferase 1
VSGYDLTFNRRNEQVNVLDLFSGIGGFSLGLERAGMRTVAFCEIEPFCQRVLQSRWPHVRCYQDIRTVTAERLAANASSGDIQIDVICGGFPCQDISCNGLKMGLEGSRSGLWREFARLIGEIRPRYAIVENVAAITFRGLGRVLADLTEIGYDAEWHVISAQSIGAPHERERCWIIAYPAGVERLYESHIAKEAQRLFDDAPPWSTCPWDEATAAICRMDDGIPDRVDRTSALGNSVVPQIPEIIGRAIMNTARMNFRAVNATRDQE